MGKKHSTPEDTSAMPDVEDDTWMDEDTGDGSDATFDGDLNSEKSDGSEADSLSHTSGSPIESGSASEDEGKASPEKPSVSLLTNQIGIIADAPEPQKPGNRWALVNKNEYKLGPPGRSPSPSSSRSARQTSSATSSRFSSLTGTRSAASFTSRRLRGTTRSPSRK